MNPKIHPSAQVHSTAKIGHGCIIGPKVKIGPRVWIGAYCVIGDGPPEHREFYGDLDGEKCLGVSIEQDARIYQFTTIHTGTKYPTIIEQGAAVFNHSHVAHDVLVGQFATVGGGCMLAGHTVIMPYANFSGFSCTFQKVVIGAYSFVGGNSFVTQHIPPGEKWMGSPARPAGINEIGLQRAGMTLDTVKEIWMSPFEVARRDSQ